MGSTIIALAKLVKHSKCLPCQALASKFDKYCVCKLPSIGYFKVFSFFHFSRIFPNDLSKSGIFSFHTIPKLAKLVLNYYNTYLTCQVPPKKKDAALPNSCKYLYKFGKYCASCHPLVIMFDFFPSFT